MEEDKEPEQEERQRQTHTEREREREREKEREIARPAAEIGDCINLPIFYRSDGSGSVRSRAPAPHSSRHESPTHCAGSS